MATLSIDIPDEFVPRVRKAFATAYGGPETNAFVKQRVVQYVKDITKAYEAGKAAEDARKTAESGADGINIS